MKRISRPDKSYIDKLLNDGNKIIDRLYEVKRDYEENLNDIDSLFENINTKNAEKIINNTTIESFGHIYPDIKVNTLKNNGFDTVGKLRKALRSNISIDGIGDVVRERIIISIDNYKKTINGENVFSFDFENKDADEEELLKSLYEYRININNITKVNKVLDDHAYDIRTRNKRVRTGLFWPIKWFFYSKDRKENIVNTIKYNEKFLEEINKLDINSIISNYYDNKVIGFDIWDEFRKDSASFYAILENIVGTSLSQDKISGDLEGSLIKKIEGINLNTDNLRVSLRGWQKFGAQYTISQKRVLIGDEMGLGKTIEAIAVMGHLKSQGKKHFFVVCPASIITNWVREIKKHSNLVPYKVHGSNRDEILNNWIEDGGVGITSYDTSRLLNFPKDLNIDLLVSDEAHYIKNDKAQRSKVVYSLTDTSEYVMYMTGTPIENNLEEMLTIIDKLQPDIVKNILEKPYLLSKELFKETIAPVYIRRNRKDVLMELPDLIQVEEWVEFGSSDKEVYEQYVREGNFMGMRRAAFLGESSEKPPKLNRLIELVKESIENNNKVIIFSFFRDVISKVYNELKDISVEPITGSVSNKKRQELIDEFSTSYDKMVLISQIQAGGVGLNIQSANTIILCEPQIKPSLETQAISRAYRMGQVKNVFVYRLLTENSVDELMMKMLGNKQYVFDTYAKESYITDESLAFANEQNIKKQIIQKEKERLSKAS